MNDAIESSNPAWLIVGCCVNGCGAARRGPLAKFGLSPDSICASCSGVRPTLNSNSIPLALASSTEITSILMFVSSTASLTFDPCLPIASVWCLFGAIAILTALTISPSTLTLSITETILAGANELATNSFSSADHKITSIFSP